MKEFKSFFIISTVFCGLLASATGTHFAGSRIQDTCVAVKSNHESPFQGVAIVDQEEKDICSVVLIKKDWVLTARLCYLKVGTQIHFGTDKWCEKDSGTFEYKYDDGQEMRTVTKTFEHPDGTNSDYPGQSLLLAKLNSPVTLTDNIEIATLAKKKPEEGAIYYIDGWGAGRNCYLTLSEAHKIADSSCNATWGKGDVFGEEICVICGPSGGTPADCLSDTGSPLSQDDEVYGVVVRYTDQSEQGKFPITLVLPVSPYKSWIDSIINSN